MMHDLRQRQIEDFRLGGDEESQQNGAKTDDAADADAAIEKQFPEDRRRHDRAGNQNRLKNWVGWNEAISGILSVGPADKDGFIKLLWGH